MNEVVCGFICDMKRTMDLKSTSQNVPAMHEATPYQMSVGHQSCTFGISVKNRKYLNCEATEKMIHVFITSRIDNGKTHPSL